MYLMINENGLLVCAVVEINVPYIFEYKLHPSGTRTSTLTNLLKS